MTSSPNSHLLSSIPLSLSPSLSSSLPLTIYLFFFLSPSPWDLPSFWHSFFSHLFFRWDCRTYSQELVSPLTIISDCQYTFRLMFKHRWGWGWGWGWGSHLLLHLLPTLLRFTSSLLPLLPFSFLSLTASNIQDDKSTWLRLSAS